MRPPPPTHLLSTPEHTASRLPVPITREDKWPHSGTPCQICLSKTKLCAALREKRLAAAGEQAGLVGADCRGFVNACGSPRHSGQAGPPLPLKCQAAWLGALSRPGTDFLLQSSPTPPHVSSAELGCGGGTCLPSSCPGPCTAGGSCLGKDSGPYHQAPGNGPAISPV